MRRGKKHSAARKRSRRRTCRNKRVRSRRRTCRNKRGGMTPRDARTVLGVEPSATLGQIKKAYKRSALKWHPDKNRSEEATSAFQKIGSAYEVLNDLSLAQQQQQRRQWQHERNQHEQKKSMRMDFNDDLPDPSDRLVVWYKRIIQLIYTNDSPLLSDDGETLTSDGQNHYTRFKNIYEDAGASADDINIFKTKWTNQDAENFIDAFGDDNIKNILKNNEALPHLAEAIDEREPADKEAILNDMNEQELTEMLEEPFDQTTPLEEHEIHAIVIAFLFATGKAGDRYQAAFGDDV